MMQEPQEHTVERWAWDYVQTTDLGRKLDPAPIPHAWEHQPPSRRIDSPGRPPELQLLNKARKFPGKGSLQNLQGRMRMVHTFAHHELQAAELMAWAILAFPQTPRTFRRGVLAICVEEIRHMKLYCDHLNQNDVSFGDFPVRDWFWTRVPLSQTPQEFLAIMGMGLEGGNLDHADRFSSWFHEAGDIKAAEILKVICNEEIRHVRFATRWFQRFVGTGDFDSWRRHLPDILSPIMMRGDPMNTQARRRAGLSEEFLETLKAWE